MPFPWVAAAKVIPWTEVIAAAPGLARGARELWQRTRKHDADATESAETSGETGPDARIAALERCVADLAQEGEMRAELIARLAEQNEQLVAALERQKQRGRIAIALLCAAIAALWLLSR